MSIIQLEADFRAFPSSRVTLDVDAVVGNGGSYRLNDSFEAFARIDNLFDETCSIPRVERLFWFERSLLR